MIGPYPGGSSAKAYCYAQKGDRSHVSLNNAVQADPEPKDGRWPNDKFLETDITRICPRNSSGIIKYLVLLRLRSESQNIKH